MRWLPTTAALLVGWLASGEASPTSAPTTSQSLPSALPTDTTFIGCSDGDLCTSYTGTIPTQLGLLTAVTVLALSGNELTQAIPTELGLMSALLQVDVGSNGLDGALATELGQLSLVGSLELCANAFNGSVPSELGNLVQMSSNFNLNDNDLSQRLPTELGRLTHLQAYFELSTNALTNQLPSQLGNLKLLRSHFRLESNQLSRRLPTELGRLTQLHSFFGLSDNKLSQAMCTEIGQLANLNTSLALGSNSLTGQLPSEIGSLSNLETSLYLHSNGFSGKLPSQLGSLTKLEAGLQLDDNAFTTSVPSELGRLVALTSSLSLIGNDFRQAPTELGQLTGLQHSFSLYSNKLQQPIPSEFGQLTALTVRFSLQKNGWTSSIPSELGRLVSMKSYFQLSGADLEGTMPTELGRLTNLVKVFNLYSNDLSQHIPSELGLLESLTYSLALKGNQFCGDLPTEVAALSSQVLGGWKMTTDNDLGTPCCVALDDVTCAPTSAPTPAPSIPPPTSQPTPLPTVFCRRGEFLNGNECSPCEAGKYRNSTDVPAVCSTCPAGTYRGYSTDRLNALECTDCPSGKLSAPDRTDCEECSAGEYAFNSTSCELCEAGRYAPTAQKDSCLECSAGFATGKRLGATECLACDAGEFAAAESINCSTCDVGTYSTARSEECIDCEGGRYADSVGSSTCTFCDVGKYANSSAAACTNCDAGTYSSSGASSCTACASGYYRPAGSTSGCALCNAGHYGASSGLANCSVCDVGTFQSATGQTECDDCEAGKYAGSVGSPSCTPCDAGTYANSSAATCTDCAAGTFSNTGARHCTPCESGKYSAASASSCLKCSSEVGTAFTSTPGASSCDLCLPGYYYDSGQDAGEQCVECPDGVDCDQTGSTLEALMILPGYYRFTKTSTDVYECIYARTCAGGNSTDDSERCWSASGPLCATCAANTYLDVASESCKDCGSVLSDASLVFLALGFLLCLLVLFVYRLWQMATLEEMREAAVIAGVPHRRRASLAEWQSFRMSEERKVSAEDESAEDDFAAQALQRAHDVVVAFITTTQTVLILLDNHESMGGHLAPKIFTEYFNFWSFVSLNVEWVPGFGCLLLGYEYDLISQTSVFFAINALLTMRWWQLRTDGNSEAWVPLKFLVYFCQLVLPAVSSTIFAAFRCEVFDDGAHSFLLADLDINCDGDLYYAVRLYAMVMIVLVPVGLPLVALVQLMRLAPHFEGCADGKHYEQHPVLGCSPLLPLFQDFEPQFAHWFSVADMARRLVLTCGTLVVSQLSSFTTLSLGVACLALCINEHLEPFEEDFNDSLASAQHWQTLLLLILLLLGDASMFSTSRAYEIAGGCLAAVNLLMVLMIFYDLLPSHVSDLFRGESTRTFVKAMRRESDQAAAQTWKQVKVMKWYVGRSIRRSRVGSWVDPGDESPCSGHDDGPTSAAAFLDTPSQLGDSDVVVLELAPTSDAAALDTDVLDSKAVIDVQLELPPKNDPNGSSEPSLPTPMLRPPSLAALQHSADLDVESGPDCSLPPAPPLSMSERGLRGRSPRPGSGRKPKLSKPPRKQAHTLSVATADAPEASRAGEQDAEVAL